jgi:hypothetical protein
VCWWLMICGEDAGRQDDRPLVDLGAITCGVRKPVSRSSLTDLQGI